VLVLADPAHSPFLDRHAPALLAAVAAHGVPISVHHQTAGDALTSVRHSYAGLEAEVTGHLDDIGPAYAAADFVLCRAGASTLAELAVFGLPALLVPLARAAEGHQEHNAGAYGAGGAALLASEAGWDRESLAARVASLLADPEAWSTMSARARARAQAGAAEALLADAALALARRRAAAATRASALAERE
jgi:UDP-N-acetylglucosamine--N-acetylmuramyl-(pentapeptide) pyrophosphoryl-undecaprenol N-acetylglucosamine transferase